MTPFAALLSMGISERLTTPAFVSKTILPSARLAIVVVPEIESILKIPVEAPVSEAPTLSTPVLERVRKLVVVAEVDEEMAKRKELVSPFWAEIENLAQGVEVP